MFHEETIFSLHACEIVHTVFIGIFIIIYVRFMYVYLKGLTKTHCGLNALTVMESFSLRTTGIPKVK